MKSFVPFLSFLLFTITAAFGQDPEPAAPKPSPYHSEEDGALSLDEITVTATPLARTLFEQAQAVSVLSGPRLQQQTQATLGETLSTMPGVRSSYFGPAASRPVIRGLDADRIRILQNGVNTIDASGTSVDHAVSFDPIGVESIEIVRGPATLLYGANAIGGVVNVIDNRIPDEPIEVPVRGILNGRYSSVDDGLSRQVMAEGGFNGWNYHVELSRRELQDLQIPGFARSARLRALEPLAPGETEETDVLTNSFLDAEGFSTGVSRTWDGGFFGLAFSGYDALYGTVAEKEVTIDLTNRRWDFRGRFDAPLQGIKAINYRLAVSNYEHVELEGPEVGTLFSNDGYDGRIEVLHEKVGRFEGAFGYQGERSDFAALGAEAFLPPVLTTSNSGFLFEEFTLTDTLKLQGGLRYDHISAASSSNEVFGPGRSRIFGNVSGSVGMVFTPNDEYATSFAVSHSERAPTYQELYANGPHLATNAFEIGDADLPTEQALGLDLSFRKRTGFVTGAVSTFYNRFDGFVGLFGTGAEALLDEGESLPILAYRSTEAQFYGGEVEATLHLLGPVSNPDPVIAASRTQSWAESLFADPMTQSIIDLELKADIVQATDTVTGDPLPRISPFHASAALVYGLGDFGARFEGIYAGEQDRVAVGELPTDDYLMFNAVLSQRILTGGLITDFYVKGVNLTDEEAREHTSFLKDIAPLAGRGIVVGAKVSF